MHRSLMTAQRLVAGVLAATIITTSAHAIGQGRGCNLRWDHCYGDSGVHNRNFACDTEAGSERLVGSFVPGFYLPEVIGLEIELSLASASLSLPSWWAFKNAGTCRQGSLSFNMTPENRPVTACADWGEGQAVGGLAEYNIGFRGTNTARLTAGMALPQPTIQVVLSGFQEYFGFNLTINHRKTVGTDPCAGCTTPVCLVLNSVRMVTPIANHRYILTGPANQVDSDFATWQGGGVPMPGYMGCPAATPTQRRSWGAVKALYR